MKTIRFIPTGIHAYFDYIGGIVLLAAPFIFNFYSVGGAAVIVPMVLGAGLILYSLLTNYELGIPGVKFIPMWMHLVFDFVASAFLALSPAMTVRRGLESLDYVCRHPTWTVRHKAEEQPDYLPKRRGSKRS